MAIDPKPDFYAILGVPPSADDIAIREAFEGLTQRYHPDSFAGSQDEAHRKMSELTTAYEVLADPVRRRRYDLHQRIDARTAPLFIKDPSRNKRPPPAVANQISVAPRPHRHRPPRQYRVPLSALVAVVVVVTAVSTYQYWGRVTEWLGSRPPAPPVAANVKPVSETPLPATTTETTAPTAAAETNPADPTRIEGPQTAVTLRQETKPAPAKPAVAKSAPAIRTGNAPPAAAASEPCSDVVTALGLCRSNSTVKDK